MRVSIPFWILLWTAGVCLAQVSPQAIFFESAVPGTFTGTDFTRWASYQPGQMRFDSGLTVAFAGANPKAVIEGEGESQGRIHHILAGRASGNASTWGQGVGSRAYREIVYRNLYSGIDLRCRFTPAGWKNDFIVQPGADFSRIRMRYRADGGPVTLGESQQLRIRTAGGEMEERIPAIYQTSTGGQTIPRRGAYRVGADGTIGFTIDAVDPALPLVIDPELYYSSYWSGSRHDSISAVAMGADDSIFIAGYAESTNIPVPGAYQATHRGSTDGFVAKLAPGGKTLLWATFYGGTASERITAMALDANSRPVFGGWTNSTDLPKQSPIQTSLRGSTDSFVARLAANGATLDFATYYGGMGADSLNAIAVDSTGIYFAGQTTSTDYPTVSALHSTSRGAQDGFVTKLNTSGSASIYSTYIGGNGDDAVMGIAIRSGEAYIAGGTSSSNLTVLNGGGPRGGLDGFVMRLSASGATLLYSTYIGGSSTAQGLQEHATCIAVNNAGEAIIGGVTNSTNFPVVNPAQATLGGGGSDGFVMKLSANGATTLWSTYLGGSSYDIVSALTLRSTGQIAVAGMTGSFNFPVLNPIQASHGGVYDAFVTTLATANGAITFSTLWGGSGSDAASSIAAGYLSGNLLLIGGTTSSINLPTLNAYQSTTTDFVNTNGFWANILVPGGNVPKRDKVGIFRNGGWALDKTGDYTWNTGDVAFSLGVAGDTPIVGDWDGTGKKRVGIFRNGVWYLDTTGDNNWTFGIDKHYYFGVAGDKPVLGDWAGVGKTCLGVYRAGIWYLDWNCNGAWNTGIDKAYSWGTASDIPITGDWTGTGITRGGLYFQGNWKLDVNGDWAFTAGVDTQTTLGAATDLPIVADFAGTGGAPQLYGYRPSTGAWFFIFGTLGIFGYPGDVPIVGPW